mgnify:FL=1
MKLVDIRALPDYNELLERTDAPPGSSWGLFGKDDQLGTLNFLSAETRNGAAACIKNGQAFYRHS